MEATPACGMARGSRGRGLLQRWRDAEEMERGSDGVFCDSGELQASAPLREKIKPGREWVRVGEEKELG